MCLDQARFKLPLVVTYNHMIKIAEVLLSLGVLFAGEALALTQPLSDRMSGMEELWLKAEKRCMA